MSEKSVLITGAGIGIGRATAMAFGKAGYRVIVTDIEHGALVRFDAAGEMERVYGRPVTVIPTHKPVARVQRPTRIFRAVDAKWRAIVATVFEPIRFGS